MMWAPSTPERGTIIKQDGEFFKKRVKRKSGTTYRPLYSTEYGLIPLQNNGEACSNDLQVIIFMIVTPCPSTFIFQFINAAICLLMTVYDGLHVMAESEGSLKV